MNWYERALEAYNFRTFSTLSIPSDLQSSISSLNSYFSHYPFLNGFSLCPDDFFLANTLQETPSIKRIIESKGGPSHLCRWYFHIQSLHPDSATSSRGSSWSDIRLISALRSNRTKAFEELLPKADIYAKDAGGVTAIHIASKTGNLEAIDLLMKRGVSLETEDHEGATPIFYAVRHGDLPTIKHLINLKTNVLHKEKQGRSLLYWACSSEKLDVVEFLLGIDINVNEETVLGRTALSKSAWNGSERIVERLLQVPGIQVNGKDFRGRTPLHNAVWGASGGRSGKKMGKSSMDSPKCTLMLIQNAASIEEEDAMGNTPACIASSTDAPDSLIVLLNAQANIYHRNKENLDAFEQAVVRGNVECARILLQHGYCIRDYDFVYIIIKFNEIESFRFLIDEIGASVNSEHAKYALEVSSEPMIEAVVREIGVNPDLIEYALANANENGKLWAVKNIKNIDEDILLRIIKEFPSAARQSVLKYSGLLNLKIIETCLENHIIIEDLIDKFPVTGEMLMSLIMQKKEKLAIKLLKKDIGLHKYKNSTGQTPLHIAGMNGLSAMTESLIKLSDDPESYINTRDDDGLTAQFYAENARFYYLREFLNSDCSSRITVLSYSLSGVDHKPHPLEELPTSYIYMNIEKHPMTKTNLVWVDSLESLNKAKTEISQHDIVSIDLEYFTFASDIGCICLIQISVPSKDFVIDALANREYLKSFIQELMVDCSKVKVMHGGDTDILWLQNDFDAHCARVFDTAKAYKVLTGEASLPSYARLVYLFLGVKINKTFQISDWRIRPLPNGMIEYARTDSHYLLDLYQKLLVQLDKHQIEVLARLCNSMCKKMPSGKLKKITLIVG